MIQPNLFQQTFLKYLAENPLPNLDIQDRSGFTGYIDFINSSEFNSAAVQGVDYYQNGL